METASVTSVGQRSITKTLAVVLLTVGILGISAAALILFRRLTPTSKPIALSAQPVQARSQPTTTNLLMRVKDGVDAQQVVNSAMTEFVNRTSEFEQTIPSGQDKAVTKSLVQPTAKIILPSSVARPLSASKALSATKAAVVQNKLQSSGLLRWHAVQITGVDDPRTMLDIIRRQDGVENVHVDAVSSVQLVRIIADDPPSEGGEPFPNDPFYTSQGAWGQNYQDQWWLHRVAADQVWPTTTGSTSTIVAVVDTGIGNHSELADRLWTNPNEIPNNGIDDDANGVIDDVRGFNSIDFTDNIDDGFGHGTHVAGIIGAGSNNGQGIASVAWHPKIMAIKSLNDSGYGDEYGLANGVLYAIINGANSINMSWGSANPDQPFLRDALRLAHDLDITLIAAAGNSNSQVGNAYPAAWPWVMSVGAWTPDNTRASFSNHGTGLDLVAPGVNVLSLRAPNTDLYQDGAHIIHSTYYVASGTSMAAPVVAGEAALLQAAVPQASSEVIALALKLGAEDLGLAGWDTDSGYGLARPASAISAARMLLNQPRFDLGAVAVSGQTLLDRQRALTITVVNEGNAPSTVAPYVILDDTTGIQIGTGSIDPVAAGEEFVLTTTIPAGEHDVRFVLDPQSVTADVLTGNNAVTGTVDQLIVGYPESREGYQASSADLYDVNGDGTKEIVSSWWNPSGQSIVDIQDARTQTSLSGWPKTLSRTFSHVVIDDIDLDGQLDIIAFADRADAQTPAQLYRWDVGGHLKAGWPKDVTVIDTVSTELAIADVIGDTKKEIVTQGGMQNSGEGYLMVWDTNGQTVSPWPKKTAGYSYEPVSLADIDGDGKLDILSVTYGPDFMTGQMTLSYLHGNGTPVSGWGTQVVTGNPTNAIMTDITGDGIPEIVTGASLNLSYSDGRPDLREQQLYAWSVGGQLLTGWPKSIEHDPPAILHLSPINAADINGDGINEILVSTLDGRAHAIKGDGSEVAGWPFIKMFGPFGEWLDLEGAVANITHDAKPEYIVSGSFIRIYALDQNGQALSGWPSRERADWCQARIRVGDVSGDHIPEILAISCSGQIYLLAASNTVIQAGQDWPISGHDTKRSYMYSATPVSGSVSTSNPRALPVDIEQ